MWCARSPLAIPTASRTTLPLCFLGKGCRESRSFGILKKDESVRKQLSPDCAVESRDRMSAMNIGPKRAADDGDEQEGPASSPTYNTATRAVASTLGVLLGISSNRARLNWFSNLTRGGNREDAFISWFVITLASPSMGCPQRRFPCCDSSRLKCTKSSNINARHRTAE